jgi:hypothetical protein
MHLFCDLKCFAHGIQIRRLVAALRPAASSGPLAGTGAAASSRDTPVLDACQQLAGLLCDQQERHATFVAENGIASLIELLDERNVKVRMLIFPQHLRAQALWSLQPLEAEDSTGRLLLPQTGE